MSCKTCKLDLEDDYVTCGQCNSNYHFQCSGVSDRTWKAKSVARKQEWKCVQCRDPGVRSRLNSANQSGDQESDDGTQPLEKIISSILAKHTQNLNDKLDHIEEKINTWTSKMDTMLDSITRIEQDITRLQQTTQDLRNRCNDMKTNVDRNTLEIEELKQYSRNHNIEIVGLPTYDNLSLRSKVKEIIEKIGVGLDDKEYVAHYVKGKTTQNNKVIVQFTNRYTRDTVMKQAKKAKPRLSLIVNNETDRAIYFNDHLTPYYRQLFYEARKTKNIKGFQFTWFSGTNVFMKKDPTGKVFKIKHVSDLEKL
jgi:uncharacterized protein YoxC